MSHPHRYPVRSIRFVIHLTLAVLALLVTLPVTNALAAPRQQATIQTPSFENIAPEIQGAYALLAQATQAVGTTLAVVDQDFTAAGLTQENLQEQLAAQAGALQVLRPGTRLALQTTWQILGAVAQGLDTAQYLRESDLAEELTFNPGVLAGQEVEDDGGVIETQEGADPGAAGVQGAFPGLDVDTQLAAGQCGDITALVRVARRDIARALGFGSSTNFGAQSLGSQFLDEQPLSNQALGGQTLDNQAQGAQIDPSLRLYAIDALRARYAQMQEALNCLAGYTPMQAGLGNTPTIGVNDVLSDGGQFQNQPVALQGAVTAFGSGQNAFMLGEGESQIGVLTRQPLRRSLQPGETLMVQGEVRPFDRAAIESELGYTLDDEVANQLEGQSVIIADSVRRMNQLGIQ